MFKALQRLVAFITGENKENKVKSAQKQALHDAQLRAKREQSNAVKGAKDSYKLQESTKKKEGAASKVTGIELLKPQSKAKDDAPNTREKSAKAEITPLPIWEDFGVSTVEFELLETENLLWETEEDPDFYYKASDNELEDDEREDFDRESIALDAALESEFELEKFEFEVSRGRFTFGIKPLKPVRRSVTTPERLMEKLLPSIETHKKDWIKFQEALKKHDITRLYHFTDRDNLASIRAAGGLLSWYSCKQNDINIARPGGSESSWMLDSRKGLADYVRLAFIPDHPMMYVASKDGRLKSPIVLEIDPAVIFFQATKFSEMNAVKNGVFANGELDKFLEIRFNVFRKRYFDLTDDEKPYYQAEVLIHKMLPAKYILNLDQLPV